MRKRFLVIIVFAEILLYTLGTFAQEPTRDLVNPAQFKKRLAEATQATTSIESNFSQVKEMSVLSEKIESKGKFYFRKKNLLRWEYTYPYQYLIILNNGKILIRDEEKEKHFDARSNKVFEEINAILLGCAQGTLLNEEHKFQPSYYETAANFLVRMKPKEARLKEIFSEISIWFDKDDLSVTRLMLREPDGDYTSIRFSERKLNSPIPDEKFRTH